MYETLNKYLSNKKCIVNVSSHTFNPEQKSNLKLNLIFSYSGKPSFLKLIHPIECYFKYNKVTPFKKETSHSILADAISAINFDYKPNRLGY